MCLRPTTKKITLNTCVSVLHAESIWVVGAFFRDQSGRGAKLTNLYIMSSIILCGAI